MFFCSSVKYYCIQNARNDTEFCVRQKNIGTYFFHAKAQRTRSGMFFCSYVKYYCTQNARNDTEFCFDKRT